MTPLKIEVALLDGTIIALRVANATRVTYENDNSPGLPIIINIRRKATDRGTEYSFSSLGELTRVLET